MKRLIMTLAVAIATTAAMLAHEPEKHKFDPVKFQKHMERALTKEAGLSTAEATALFPIYNEMKEKQRAKSEQIRAIKKQTYTTDKECQKALLQVKELQVEIAELEETYFKKMCKAIPATKVFRLMQAEDKLHRHMIQGPRRDKDTQKQPRKRQ